jgi:hypothetical protein
MNGRLTRKIRQQNRREAREGRRAAYNETREALTKRLDILTKMLRQKPRLVPRFMWRAWIGTVIRREALDILWPRV